MSHNKNQQYFSLKKKKRLKETTNGNYKPLHELRLGGWNRFGSLTLVAFIFTVIVTFLSPAWLPTGQSVASHPLAQETNEILILAQEEEEEAREEESPREEATEEESPREEATEEAGAEESAGEEAGAEELPFEEAKKSLEEAIDEKYEEWESQKTSSEVFHSISGIFIIIITVVITFLGSGLFDIPYKSLVILALGVAIIFIQLNINIFILEKSLAGYEILTGQGSLLKEKLESVRTEEELKELREQFQELVIESLATE